MVCARCGSAAVSEKQLPSRDFHELRRSELGIDRGSSVGENKLSMSEIRERQQERFNMSTVQQLVWFKCVAGDTVGFFLV